MQIQTHQLLSALWCGAHTLWCAAAATGAAQHLRHHLLRIVGPAAAGEEAREARVGLCAHSSRMLSTATNTIPPHQASARLSPAGTRRAGTALRAHHARRAALAGAAGPSSSCPSKSSRGLKPARLEAVPPPVAPRPAGRHGRHGQVTVSSVARQRQRRQQWKGVSLAGGKACPVMPN